MSATPLDSADPLRVAWRSLSEHGAEEPDADGECARCAVLGPIVPLKDVVSENFTGWEGLDPSAPGLCVSCSWGYTPVELRTRPVLVHREEGAIWATPDQVLTSLCQPFPPDMALSMPVAGKKHLLPYAEWGTVSSDGGPLPWTQEAANLARTLVELRFMGVREKELSAPAAPYRVVIALMSDTEATMRILNAWTELHAWQDGPYFAVAVRGTRLASLQLKELTARNEEAESAEEGERDE